MVQTPHLDAFAAQGVHFGAHYAQATPCGPSRASLLTGTYLHTNRVVFNGTPLDAGLTNLALEARAGGYDPQLFGYTDTTVDPRTVPEGDPLLSNYEGDLPGFTVALGLHDDRADWYLWLEQQGYDIADRERFLHPIDELLPEGRGPSWPPTVFEAEETETAFVVDRVIEHLSDLPEPWFVHVSILRPHPPWTVPAPYNDLHDPAEVPEVIPVGDDSHPFLQELSAWHFGLAVEDDFERRQVQATYYGMVAEVDHQMGRLLAALQPVEDHTVVAITSDHGELMGDHGLFSKLGFHDQAFHIPLLLRLPGVNAQAGLVVEEFTENVDVMPTLLDLAGLPIPEQCQGHSLRPFLEKGRAEGWRTAVHWEFDFRVFARTLGLPLEDCHLMVERTRSQKLVSFSGYPNLFFDLTVDPGEQRPLLEHLELSKAEASLAAWRPSPIFSELVNRLATPKGMITLRDPEGELPDF
jgi:arylsulfatase A-like enzyme